MKIRAAVLSLLLATPSVLANNGRGVGQGNGNGNGNGGGMEDEDVEILVVYKNERAKEHMKKVSKNGKIEKEFKNFKIAKIRGSKASMEELRLDPDVVSVEENLAVSLPPIIYETPQERRLAEEEPYGIRDVQADQLGVGSAAMKVCIVDTGYDLGHLDLPGSSHGVAGINPYPNDEKWDVDGHGHGTHCAGTVGAIGNNEGVVGIIKDPTKFSFYIGKGLTDSGSGFTDKVLEAVDECVTAQSNVISLSLGGGPYSESSRKVYNEAYDAGVLIVAAAGNSGNSVLSYPASYASVMSVAAVDENGIRAGFSQYNDQVEIAAPGVGVKSTLPNDGYASWSGTSMATPHVAGVAALVWSHFPDCTNHQIRGALLKTALDKGEGCDNEYGFGIVQAKAAYDLLLAQGCEAGGNSPSPLSNDNVGGCGQPIGPVAPTPAPTQLTCTNQWSAKLTLDLDNYPEETSWTLKTKDNGQIEQQGSDYSGAGSTVIENFCMQKNTEYEFTINDTFGDGMCCGYGNGGYTLACPDSGMADITGGVFASSETRSFMSPGDAGPTPAPTVPPTPAPTSMSNFKLELLTDGCPGETTWNLKDSSGEVTWSGGPYSVKVSNEVEEVSLPSGLCYEFTISDSYADGICCGYGAGSYKLFYNNALIHEGGEFGDSETKYFGASNCAAAEAVGEENLPPSPDYIKLEAKGNEKENGKGNEKAGMRGKANGKL